MRKPRQPDPEVLEFDYRVPTALGSVAWTVALGVLLVQGDGLPEEARWWIWVCVTGIALGVFAYFYIPWLLRRRGAADERQRVERASQLAAVGRPDTEPARTSDAAEERNERRPGGEKAGEPS